MASLELKRRELIGAFLGTAVATAACKRPAPRGKIEGALVDRVVETGHLLRGAAPLLRAAELRDVDVVIVGAGAAGLSAGWRLSAAGVKNFVMLEVDAEAGGTARSGKNAVSAFPWGAHYLPAPTRDGGPVMRLLRELGAVVGVDDTGRPRFAEQMLIRDPDERVFYKGLWYEGLYLKAGATVQDLAELARFEQRMNQFAAARDGKGRKAFSVPMAAGSDDAEWVALDKLSMAQWLEQEKFTSPRLRWLVDYACRDDFGTLAAGTSAYAGIWYFAARHEGDERSAGYLSWPEGNGRLIRHLREKVSDSRIATNVLAHTVALTEGGCEVHAFDAATKGPVGFRCKQVVVAAPRFIAARLVEAWRQKLPSFVSEFEYAPWVVANLSLSSRPPSRGFPLAWDNVFYESQSLGYVVATHQAPVAFDQGPTVFTWYYPLPGADVKAERSRLLSTGYDDWESLLVADLSVGHPRIEERATRLEVMRWGHAMVRPRPGFLFGNARRLASAPLGGRLHFAHSDLGGLALFEEANHFGVRAAEFVLSALGRQTSSWL